MVELKALSNQELAYLILLKIWWFLDNGGFSEGRLPRSAVIEAITRSKLLPDPKGKDIDVLRSTLDTDIEREVKQRGPDRYLERTERRWGADLAFLRNKEYLTILLKWLQVEYEKEMKKEHDLTTLQYEYWMFRLITQLLPIPAEAPTFRFDEIIRERDRRARKRLGSKKKQLVN